MLAAWVMVLAGGCGAKKKEITELQRKEAELLVAEANFAANLRDWARAEGLLVKATNLTPDEGAYWTSLGAMRVRLGHKGAAKTAYERAVKAYQEEIAADKAKSDVEPWLRQVYVLALLGRVSEGRALLDRAARQFPTNREVRAFIDGKQLDAMLADPLFKQEAL
jgi:tetratricopeptide (TPR) repeat protein